MTAAVNEILIPAPLDHQTPIVESSARFKVCRAGRRGGKTVLAEGCAIVGHGPVDEATGVPLFRGIVHDLDVVWVARDYTQAGIMWHEFIRPRFKGVDGVRVNEADRTVSIEGAGTLFVISAENIASARGMGARLAGVIVEEAAWLDLQAALRDVLLPALMDNEGWLLLISTTNAGSDGGRDESGQPRTPSYFNTICEEVRAKARSEEWEEFHFTAEDNPKISARSFASLIAEYAPGSPSLEQEVYAKLLKAGIGLALPSLDEKYHLVPRFKVPDHWMQFGGFDWGFNHPWVFGWYACDEDGGIVKIDTLWGRQDLPNAIFDTICSAVPVARLRSVLAGTDIFYRKGHAAGFQGPTIAEIGIKRGLRLMKADTTPGSRVKGLDNFRAYVDVPAPIPDGDEFVQVPPRFTMMNTDGNRRCLAQLQAMQIDPDNREDALKVDADAAGRGGDDGYDETRMALMSRPITLNPDRHEEKYDKTPHRARPWQVDDQGHPIPHAKSPKSADELAERLTGKKNQNRTVFRRLVPPMRTPR